MKAKGLFITFEGTEGSGKSTQIKRAADYLRRKGYRVLVLREPGGTRVSEAIRKIILNKNFLEMRAETELLLYVAARTQIVREKILPALKKGMIVICDRFEDSTMAYQGYGRRIPMSAIHFVSRSFVRGSLQPDLTFLLDVDMREGLRRSGRDDRMEREPLSFHEKVRRGFLTLARKNPKRFIVLGGRRSREAVARTVREILDKRVKG